jgi:hypothetical protein
MLFKCVFTRRKSHQSRIFDSFQFYKPAVRSPLEHGCKDGKFGLEPILFEGQMSSDFLQDLVYTVVFMICLKKELLRAYASSSISVLCVITLWQRSNAWQGQSFVQDKKHVYLRFYLWITLIKKTTRVHMRCTMLIAI